MMADIAKLSENESLRIDYGAVEQYVLQHKGPQEELGQLGKMMDLISDYQDDDGFATDDVIRNAPAYLDAANVEDPLSLEPFFEENKYCVPEAHKSFLEEVAISGMPNQYRRQYWLAITGAYGYLRHYSDGYYDALASEGVEVLYPKWPHPDYQEILKDVPRTFSKEPFFQD
jgi:hypothetical protein